MRRATLIEGVLPGVRVRLLVGIAFLAAAGATLVLLGIPSPSEAQEFAWGLTAIPGLKVGHFTLSERPTGCTVVLAEGGAVGGVDVRGGAPGTREIALLDPVNTVQEVHAVVLSGGSAFGLDAASGVVRYLDERDIGYRVGQNVVPIVVGAILYDLSVGNNPRIRPDADCGYRAASHASTETSAEGNVGAGAGATVGKLGGMARAMKGGVGTTSITLDNGLTVAGHRRGQRGGGHHRSGHGIGHRGCSYGRRTRARRCTHAASDRSVERTTERCQHDARSRRDQRDTHEGRGDEGRADGPGWSGPYDLPRPHVWRRRHGLLFGHGHVLRGRLGIDDRSLVGRRGGGGDRARREGGYRNPGDPRCERYDHKQVKDPLRRRNH